MTRNSAYSKNIRALEALVRERGFGRLGGGLPRGAISEVTGPCSSGRTGLLMSMLAQLTQAGGIAAYVDVTDCLDPRSAEQAGVLLDRLLWIRGCTGQTPRRARGERRLPPMEEAWQTANLIVSSGVFGVVAVDLGGLSMRHLADWQRRTWTRLKHAAKDTQTALFLLAERHLAGSAAEVVLELRRETIEWDGLLGEIGVAAEVPRPGVRVVDRVDMGRAA